ncbi:MAG: proline racemase family protein [Planctomycetales bacterium]|nr:proline racemase family protein [Planctomycetales bacterium]
MLQRIPYVDTHTGGEPTRILTQMPFELAGKSCAEKLSAFRNQYDNYRKALVCEPRGNDVLVGAILVPTARTDCATGVIFVNNVGYLGMCGHGTIGLAVALRYLRIISDGMVRFETPVGDVSALVLGSQVTIQNVPSYRYMAAVALELANGQGIVGDIAWGGNWFFIVENHQQELTLQNVPQLVDFARLVRRGLHEKGIRGAGDAVIDHVELIGPASNPDCADAKNFVLCPGGAYDRSPCGTGTSAKLACMAADRSWPEDATFRQESIIGSVFQARYSRLADDKVLPTIVGEAHVCGHGELLLDAADPFCMGIPNE